MKPNYLFSLLIFLILTLHGCDDLEDFDSPITNDTSIREEGTAELYVLSEGLFNLNNSTLARHTFTNNHTVTDYFRTVNHRGLGDTANDMALYGDKLYIVVNVSSQIEVVDWKTGMSIKQIPMTQENGSSRQPRSIAFHEDKAYVCCFDGSVARIDTLSLSVDAITQAGRNPDDLCVQNNKLYVSNSGGLDAETIGVDTRVSVIDLQTFKLIKNIEVGYNPGKIVAALTDKVIVVSRGQSTSDGRYQLKRINTTTDEVEHIYSQSVLNFAVNDELAYIYDYQYATKKSSFKILNLRSGEVIREKFIVDGTTIETPFTIEVNPYNGNVFITDSYSYNVKGDVLCFSPQGELQYRLNNIGMNPNTIVFSDRSSQSTVDPTPPDPNAPNEYANKVLEYLPAPGQYMNTTTTAYKENFTAQDVLNYATERLKNQYLISLGGFGGYITLGFHSPITNKPNEYDFKIYGNASYNIYGTETGKLGGSAEPGIVLVSKDSNGNGLPDDEWYELAGSEYGSTNEIRNYEIIYYKPGNSNEDVRWSDNQGQQGVVQRNEFHTQNSYYPNWVDQDQISFKGTRLKDNAVNENGMWVAYCYAWGYADNHPNNTEISKFKIDWAIDASGSKVTLDKIDFIRIYSAVNQNAGSMGEISTEVMTVENLHYKN